jgi:ABC-type transport system involved in cytochrome c biogenesis permease subunit
LTWRIIGIVAVVILTILLVLGLALQYAIKNDAVQEAPLRLMVNLLIVGAIGLVILYFICRRTIRHMMRPVTELSVSAMNMAKGNFKAYLPEMKTQD